MMASVETEPPPVQPSAKARRRRGAFIGVFVLLQFLIPLSYLTREDAADERFTWRSFTESEAPSCATSATLDWADGHREAISLEKLLHRDWLDYVSQNRRSVVNAFLQKQCETQGVLQVELVNHCEDDRDIREYSLRCGGGRPHETVRTAAR